MCNSIGVKQCSGGGPYLPLRAMGQGDCSQEKEMAWWLGALKFCL